MQAGYRSLLFRWGGSSSKPLSTGDYGAPIGLLAFWLGGAALNYKPKLPYEPIIGPDGPGYAKHHEGRPVNDDAEILEFLQIWTAWQDIE